MVKLLCGQNPISSLGNDVIIQFECVFESVDGLLKLISKHTVEYPKFLLLIVRCKWLKIQQEDSMYCTFYQKFVLAVRINHV